MDTLQTLISQVHEHPVSSPHLSPSDCHLFGPLKEALRSWKMADNDVGKEAVHDGLTHNLKMADNDVGKEAVRDGLTHNLKPSILNHLKSL